MPSIRRPNSGSRISTEADFMSDYVYMDKMLGSNRLSTRDEDLDNFTNASLQRGKTNVNTCEELNKTLYKKLIS